MEYAIFCDDQILTDDDGKPMVYDTLMGARSHIPTPLIFKSSKIEIVGMVRHVVKDRRGHVEG